MEAKFSPRVKDVITFSREEALRLGHDYIGVEHLLLGIIREGEGVAVQIIKAASVDMKDLRRLLEQSMKGPSGQSNNLGNIPLVKQAEKVLKITYLEAKMFKSAMIGTEHLLLSILKDEDNIATQTLQKFGVDYGYVKEELEGMIEGRQIPRSEMPGAADDDNDGAGSFGAGGGGSSRSKGD